MVGNCELWLCRSSSGFGWIGVIVILGVAYAVYSVCLRQREPVGERPPPYSPQDDSQPPPYGFRPEYTQQQQHNQHSSGYKAPGN